MIQEEELTEEQKAHISELRRKFFRFVSIFSVFFTIFLLIVLRFTLYNYKEAKDYQEYINHKDKFMRFNAAKALGKFTNDPNSLLILHKMLKDTEREVRWHAAASLSKIKSKLSSEHLINAYNRENDISAKSIYLYALGQIKDERNISFLKNILNNDKENSILRVSAIQSLASYDKEETNNILKSFEKNTNNQDLKRISIEMRLSKGLLKSD
jgi:HEAT repeat protein